MINIVRMPYGIKVYSKLEKFNRFPTKYGCEACGYEGKLYRHGYYFRNVITFKNFYRIPIIRYKCKSCCKTYSLIPSFLIPYRQYAYHVILTTLIMMFKLKYSFNKILTALRAINTKTAFSITEISLLKTRLTSSLGKIRLFFANYKVFYFNMDSDFIGDFIIKIIYFSRLRNDFNLEYSLKMRKHFLCKL